MRIIFYVHWVFCIGFLLLTLMHRDGVVKIPDIGRTSVIVGFGSLLLLACAMGIRMYVMYAQEGSIEKMDADYLLAVTVTLIARSIFEMSIFIYGSSLKDKWVVICLYCVIAFAPIGKRFLDKIK